MKSTAIRILTLALSLTLLLGLLPLSVAAEYELWDGSAKTVTMKAGEERFFIYVPAESGPHTISQSTSVIRVDFHQEDESDKDAFPEPIHTEGKANPNDECYRLKAGTRYIVRMHMWEGETEWPNGISDTISIYAGEPKKEVDLCEPITVGAHKLTVKPGEEHKYKFTPAESGRYVLYGGNTVVNIRLRHGPDSLDMPDNQLMIANPFGVVHGYMADMTAGETYIITFSMWENEPRPEGFTDTYRLEKVGDMKSATLRSAFDHKATDLFGYVGGSIQLFPYTDPLYFEAFTTAWTVSDSSVARFITEDSKQTRELELLKAGTVTVTATVNGKAVSQTITVKERPALVLNQTVKLTFGGSLGAQCTFTPAESGTYRFSMTGAGGTTVIKDTDYATYWEGSGSLTASLKAGKTYILEGAFGPKDYTVKVSRGNGGGNNPTNAAPPSGDEPTATTPSATKPTATTPTQAPDANQKPNKVPVHKENGKAQVNYEEVAHLLDGTALTVTVEDPSITAVTLPTQLLTEAASSQTPLRVELPHATVALDAAILAKVAEQTDDLSIQLSVEQVETANLTKQQQNMLKNKNVAGVVRIVLGGDTEIHDLGGTAAVTVPFTPEKGKNLSDYVVYYLDDGELKKMKTVVIDGKLTFYTTHFSDYTVVYEPQPTTTVATHTTDKMPFDMGTVILFASIALFIMLAGGIAIILITKHQATNQHNH